MLCSPALEVPAWMNKRYEASGFFWKPQCIMAANSGLYQSASPGPRLSRVATHRAINSNGLMPNVGDARPAAFRLSTMRAMKPLTQPPNSTTAGRRMSRPVKADLRVAKAGMANLEPLTRSATLPRGPPLNKNSWSVTVGQNRYRKMKSDQVRWGAGSLPVEAMQDTAWVSALPVARRAGRVMGLRGGSGLR